jgi:CheY-like chemotaxis protein
MPFPPEGPRLPDVPASALPLRGVTVLAVEDSRFTCDALRLVLTRSGARLKRAETLAAARSHLACYRPDLVIADLGLPDGRGEALIAELAATGQPVLALSGDPGARDAALDAGAVAFIDKPIPSVADFLRLVGQLVAGDRADVAGGAPPGSPADPLALRDDLARAAQLITSGGSDLGYVAGFLRSLARAAGDTALERAALAAATDTGRLALSQLVADRLSALHPVC